MKIKTQQELENFKALFDQQNKENEKQKTELIKN
jgi:hypothetical protein